MSEFLEVRNEGQKIIASNFWTLSDKGKFFVSVNAAAFRILLPASLESLLPEMATATDGVRRWIAQPFHAPCAS
jgi:hypothetical protein